MAQELEEIKKKHEEIKDIFGYSEEVKNEEQKKVEWYEELKFKKLLDSLDTK